MLNDDMFLCRRNDTNSFYGIPSIEANTEELSWFGKGLSARDVEYETFINLFSKQCQHRTDGRISDRQGCV